MLNIIKSAVNIIRSLVIFLLLLCLIIFMIDNREVIKISTYPLPFTIEARAFLVMFFFFLVGVFVGFIAFSKNMISKTISILKFKQKIKKLENNVKG